MPHHRLATALLLLAIAADAAPAAPVLLSGSKLVLKTRAARQVIKIVSLDPVITLGGGDGSTDDPVLHGGTLRIASTAGDAFDFTYPLPAARWRYLGTTGDGRGYRLRGGAPVVRVLVKPGRLMVVAKGALPFTLAANPAPVAVVLTLGGQASCLSFRGDVAFRANRHFRAVGATAAPQCGPAAALPDPAAEAWPMHSIDYRFRGANALSRADADADGFTDYVTNYEFDQRLMIYFHPGAGGAIREPWPSVAAFALAPQPIGVDTEHAAFGDFDGDGNLDVAGAQGTHPTTVFEGDEPGIRLVWGPGTANARTPGAWLDAGRIPATVEQGHFLWVEPFDVNGDGALDLLVGGRAQWDTAVNASIKWLEAPALPADRRNLALWTAHDIDPTGFDGHGVVLSDVDEDGDLDLVDANADFDTPEEEEVVQWFENPGTGTPAQAFPWPKHVIYQGPEFYPKPQIAIADLDADGLDDVITQVADAVYWFRKTSTAPVAFQRVVIPKPATVQVNARPIRVRDVNGDGRLDLVGMNTHDDGVIAGTTMSAFWMSYDGPTPTADNWTFHPIKWGSGRPMFLFTFGEKWDQVQFDDVDGDGDLDVLANCEEWWEDDTTAEFASFTDPTLDPTAVGVVWFENRLAETPHACAETADRCVLEAEHWFTQRDGTWVKHARESGYAGDGYMQVHDPQDPTARGWDDSAGLTYAVRVGGGRYTLWLRRRIPGAWGRLLGGPASDDLWCGSNGDPLGLAGGPGTADQWEWVQAATGVDLTPGRHTIELRAAEGGAMVDRLVLTDEPGFVPSGAGPAETLAAP
jgi:hypothetical protein